MEWQDQPKQKEFQLTINTPEGFKRELALNIGNCAIALFRQRPEMDYLARKDEEDIWSYYFNTQPLVYWMGGLALSDEAEHEKHLLERSVGSFRSLCGWNPDIVIEDYPSDQEIERYFDVLIGDELEDPLASLNRELEEQSD